MKVHIDVETYCELDIRKVGAYKYCLHPSFEILLFAYHYDGMDEVRVLDLTIPDDFQEAADVYQMADVIYAHNATFERLACSTVFGASEASYECSLVKSAYYGLPLALGQVSEALELEVQKDKGGTSLINFFSKPCKPTAANGERTRNLPHHDPEKWQKFKDYCKRDVETEMAITDIIGKLPIPAREREIAEIDYEINTRGVRVDVELVKKAIELDKYHRELLLERAKEISNLDNPNSVKQLIDWFNANIGETEGTVLEMEYVTSMKKADVTKMLSEVSEGNIKEMLEIRQQLSMSSVKKYNAIMHGVSSDRRVRGLFQYYGANRTGRWAGRLVQMQNLPQGTLSDEEIAEIREDLKKMDVESFMLTYGGNVSAILSSLIRSSFVPPKRKILCVADLSAIEARVLSWLANERWRLEIFNTHGKIYEASAALMYGVDIEDVDTKMRARGKVAELALGYQGSVGAMEQMGGSKIGLTPSEMSSLVTKWRRANPSIVDFWGKLEDAVKLTIRTQKPIKWHVFKMKIVRVSSTFSFLSILLPSGRSLNYVNPRIEKGKIVYWGLDDKKKWNKISTYGGKLTENITQAVSRDVLAEGLLKSRDLGLILHVHDEIGIESEFPEDLKVLIDNMSSPLPWAEGLPLKAVGFVSNFYKK